MTDPTLSGARGSPWTQFEIDATVAAYEEIPRKELRGEPYSKADVVRGLMQLMPDRTRGAVELKLQNVSAVRLEHGWRWIDGYKPMHHYQEALRAAVLARTDPRSRLSEALAEFGETAVPSPQRERRATSDALVDSPSVGGRTRKQRSSVALTGTPQDALQDLRRRSLGTAGEGWVVELEQEQLARIGRADLADLVRWVAREDGDGAGYDILSFFESGAQRLIEVKTTTMAR